MDPFYNKAFSFTCHGIHLMSLLAVELVGHKRHPHLCLCSVRTWLSLDLVPDVGLQPTETLNTNMLWKLGWQCCHDVLSVSVLLVRLSSSSFSQKQECLTKTFPYHDSNHSLELCTVWDLKVSHTVLTSYHTACWSLVS